MKKYLFVFGVFVSLLIFICPKYLFAASDGLVIDSFQIGDSASSYNEFITIGNNGTSALNLNGYSLVKKTQSGRQYTLLANFGDTTINPHQKITLVYSKSNISPADLIYSSNSISENNTLILLDSKKSIVDLAGYGEVGYFESAPLPNPNPGEVYARTGMADTDNNLADFAIKQSAEAVDLNATNLMISELYPNPKTGESEWFELFNPTSQDIVLTNLKVCDGEGSTHCYFFDKADTIPANSYKIYDQATTKITLNDSGDYLEIRDSDDNTIFQTDAFEGADDGKSFSLFGSEWRWTSVATAGSENIFQDIIEQEEKTTPKSTPKKVAAKKKTSTMDESADSITPELTVAPEETAVKAAETAEAKNNRAPISTISVGWGLVVLAILGSVGYTGYESRDKIYDFYHTFRKRDD